jgi:hypothetical protein
MSEDAFSEADLCREFRTWAEQKGWIVHPEVSGWDMVMLRSGPATELALAKYQPNDQVGIQAKLVGNLQVLYQATTPLKPAAAPAFRLVLVRRCSDEFLSIAYDLNLIVVVREHQAKVFGRKKAWTRFLNDFRWFYPRQGANRRDSVQLTLPPIVTDLPAGGPAPRQLTPWRVKALRLCALLHKRGYLTAPDFKTAKVDMRIWKKRWLNEHSKGIWHRRGADLPDVGWEKEAAQLAAAEAA